MKDIQELLLKIRELDDRLALCSRCGLCMAHCPVYAQTGLEGDSPRGRMALLESFARELISDVSGLEEKIRKCLLCGACAAACPANVPVRDIFFAARSAIAAYKGLSGFKKFFLRGLLANPTLFTFAVSFAGTWQGIFLREVNEKLGLSRIALISGLTGERHIPRIAPRFFTRVTHGSIDIMPRDGAPRALFFPGCLADKVYVSAARACLKIFQCHGVGAIMPPGLGCCGMFALAEGDGKTFSGLVRHNMRSIMGRRFDYIVAPCASCASTIRDLWPQAGIPDAMRAFLEERRDRIMDISRFVVDVLGAESDFIPEGGRRITYHDACHLNHGMGVRSQPRELILLNPDYELVEMENPGQCCGCGGGFCISHAKLADRISARKTAGILNADVEEVAVACMGCMAQITDALSRAGHPMRVRHVAEVYADALPAQGDFW